MRHHNSVCGNGNRVKLSSYSSFRVIFLWNEPDLCKYLMTGPTGHIKTRGKGLILVKIGKMHYFEVSMATMKIQTVRIFLKWNMLLSSSRRTLWCITCPETFAGCSGNELFVQKISDLYGASTLSFSGSAPFWPNTLRFAGYPSKTIHRNSTKLLHFNLYPLLHTFMEKNDTLLPFHSGQNW